ncbi:hypothetical protein ACG7TL_007090 [Trametes sanguinea]
MEPLRLGPEKREVSPGDHCELGRERVNARGALENRAFAREEALLEKPVRLRCGRRGGHEALGINWVQREVGTRRETAGAQTGRREDVEGTLTRRLL